MSSYVSLYLILVTNGLYVTLIVSKLFLISSTYPLFFELKYTLLLTPNILSLYSIYSFPSSSSLFVLVIEYVSDVESYKYFLIFVNSPLLYVNTIFSNNVFTLPIFL